MKRIHQIGLAAILSVMILPLAAQETNVPEATPTEHEGVPSVENNFGLPDTINYNGEVVTEGFWTFTLCGIPTIVVYDTDTQLAVPLVGANLAQQMQKRPWAVEGAPPILFVPDLAEVYPPLRNSCEHILQQIRRYQEQNTQDNEPVIDVPETQMR